MIRHVQTQLSDDDYRKLKIIAIESGSNIGQFIRDILESYLKEVDLNVREREQRNQAKEAKS